MIYLKFKTFLILPFLFLLTSCDLLGLEDEEDEDTFIPSFLDEDEEDEFNIPVESTSVITNTTGGKNNIRQGCVETSSRSATISLWDHGSIDGDIVSFYVNNNKVVEQYTLRGPNDKRTFDITLENNGFNFVTLFAHNLGDISPNTATVSINGKEFILEADLENNGAFDIVITGFDVSCTTNNNISNEEVLVTPEEPLPTSGQVTFFSRRDFNCGNITVTVNNSQSRVLTQFFTGGLSNCNQGGIFILPPGRHIFEAACPGGLVWEGNIDITAGGCLRFELN